MLVALGCVVFTLLDRVCCVARHRKVPYVFRELVETRRQGPNEDGHEELCGGEAHLGIIAGGLTDEDPNSLAHRGTTAVPRGPDRAC